MIEAESAPATSKKRNVVFWPSAVMLVMVFGFWVFLFDDLCWLLLWLIIEFFSVICLISFVSLIVLRRLRKSLSFFIPLLLAATMGQLFIPVPAMRPISTPLYYSRDYVEFLIYDAKHHIRAEAQQNRYEYKEWQLHKHSAIDYHIVYDTTGKTLREADTEQGGCYSAVFSLGDHFYFVRGMCPSVFF
jgi:hypothetical protein